MANLQIVFQMMVYSNAQSADHLCHLNGWGRTTVPLHGLELGLQQRQLDTVTFFLQGKQSSELDYIVLLEQSYSESVAVICT